MVGYPSSKTYSFTESLQVDTNSIGGADYSLVTNRPDYATDKDDKFPIGIVVTGITTDPSTLILKDGNGNNDTWTISAAILPFYIPGQVKEIEFTGTTVSIIMNVMWQ